MIKWKEAQAGSGRWTADIGGETALFVWPFKGEYCFDFSLARGVDIIRDAGYPTLDAAKSAAETFAREWVATQAAALGMRCVDAWHVWVAAQAAALGDGWIPVGERLPEDDTKMLVLAAHPGCAPFYSTARYFLDSDRWHTDGGDSYGGITHWRELPPPPPLPVGEVEE